MKNKHLSIFRYHNQRLKQLLLLLVLGFWLVPSSLAQSGSGLSDLQPPMGLSVEQLNEWQNLAQRYQASEQRRNLLERRLVDYEASMSRMLERLGLLTSLLLDSQTDLQKSRGSLGELKENLHELEIRLTASQEQLILTQLELEASRIESESLRERLDALGDSLQGTEASLIALSEELTQVTREYESLSTRYQELQTRLTVSLVQIDNLTIHIDTLIARIDASEGLVAQLQLDLAAAEREKRITFLKGLGIGAGGTAVITLVIWLISSLTP
jgi:chromosome segregation ATPase